MQEVGLRTHTHTHIKGKAGIAFEIMQCEPGIEFDCINVVLLLISFYR